MYTIAVQGGGDRLCWNVLDTNGEGVGGGILGYLGTK